MGELANLQRAFTEHLRNPDNVPVPSGLDKRRMGIYSELIFNNVSSLLTDFFPVIKSILSEDQWQEMVRNFFITHQSQTPYFMEISGEFVEYLAQNQLIGALPKFLPELAHYEWVELALFTMDEDLPEQAIAPDLLGKVPLSLCALAQPLQYTYPVHQISAEFQPGKPGVDPTYLMVSRGENELVRFFDLQPLSFQLLHEMQQNPGLIVKDWLDDMATLRKVENKAQFVSNGIELLQSFNKHRMFIAG